MTITVRIGEVAIECATPQEAAEVARLLKGVGSQSAQPNRQVKPEPLRRKVDDPVLALLRHLKRTGMLGKDDIVNVAGLKSSKAIGNLARTIKARIQGTGVSLDDVRTIDSSGVWVAGSLIDEVLEQLEGGGP